MKKILLIVLGVAIAIIAAVAFYAIPQYNTLVRSDEAVKTQWGFVQSAYQRRSDLIPNLVRTVEASGKFERETLEAVTQARASATQMQFSADDLSDPTKFAQFAQTQQALSGSLARLLVVIEKYPELNTSQQFRDLMTQLEGTENRINTERNNYNISVQSYNQLVRTFPTIIIASVVGMQPKEAFQATSPDAEKAPEVRFNN